MRKSIHTHTLVAILLAFGAILFGAWYGLAHAISMHGIASRVFENSFVLLLSLVLFLFAAALEWNAAMNHLRLKKMSIAKIEKRHPRFPRRHEILMTLLITAAIPFICSQVIQKVSAFSERF